MIKCFVRFSIVCCVMDKFREKKRKIWKRNSHKKEMCFGVPMGNVFQWNLDIDAVRDSSWLAS